MLEEITRRIANAAAQLRLMPMVAATVLFVCGLVVFDACDVPWWSVWTLFVICCGVAAVRPELRVSQTCIAVALFLFGGVVLSVHRRGEGVPAGRPVVLEMEIADVWSERADGLQSVPVRIVSCDDGSGAEAVESKAVMWSDGSFEAAFGDRITALSTISGFHGRNSTYFELMRRRGFCGSLFLRSDDVLSVERHGGGGTVHHAAVERFSRLRLSPSVEAVSRAVATGDRSRMTPELRRAYSLSGVSHILAVSGLHIGIIFLLANILFRPLTLLRHGQIVAAFAVLVPAWLYAAAVGFTPSVVRAALMFSMLQLSRALSAHYNSLNILAAAAFAMLTFDPDTLYDISFRLSFVAVAAIVTVGRPLYHTADKEPFVFRFLWDTFVIGSVAFVATAPLTAQFFGRLSLAGVVVNPLVILCACCMVTISVVWILVPLPMVQPLVEKTLDAVAGFQNMAVGRIANYDFMNFDIHLSDRTVAALYLFMAAVVLLFSVGRDKKMKRR